MNGYKKQNNLFQLFVILISFVLMMFQQRFDGWKKNYLPNTFLACQQHDQPIQTEAPARRRRQPVLEGAHKGLIFDVFQIVETFVNVVANFSLHRKHFSLSDGIVQLGVGVDDLEAVGIKLKSLG